MIGWLIVLQGKHFPDNTDENQYFTYETPFLRTHVRQTSEENYLDDVHVIRRDHEEGIWETSK